LRKWPGSFIANLAATDQLIDFSLMAKEVDTACALQTSQKQWKNR
jgi:hypothetical protein